ncbi:MAG: hypothetical protein JWN13_4522 [Betaproteobacteria bacterium]|jgi:hypothetical protein|nr:hypothetical protein [Betaproteobacteria bacterium]
MPAGVRAELNANRRAGCATFQSRASMHVNRGRCLWSTDASYGCVVRCRGARVQIEVLVLGACCRF